MKDKIKNEIVRVARKAYPVSFILLLSSASVAAAALTLGGTSITSDGALTLTGSGASTLDIGTGALSLQTTNNGAITAGTGLFTMRGALNVSSTFNASGTASIVATTTLLGNLVVGTSTFASDAIFSVGTSTHVLSVLRTSLVRVNGHVNSTGTTPAASVCGTSPSVVGTDNATRVTIGTGAPVTTCTLTFASTFASPPVCTAMIANTSTPLMIQASTTATTVSLGSYDATNSSTVSVAKNMAQVIFHIQCLGID